MILQLQVGRRCGLLGLPSASKKGINRTGTDELTVLGSAATELRESSPVKITYTLSQSYYPNPTGQEKKATVLATGLNFNFLSFSGDLQQYLFSSPIDLSLSCAATNAAALAASPVDLTAQAPNRVAPLTRGFACDSARRPRRGRLYQCNGLIRYVKFRHKMRNSRSINSGQKDSLVTHRKMFKNHNFR